jgi:hypothetical protein
MSVADRIHTSEWMPYLIAVVFFITAFAYTPSYDVFIAILCVAIAFQFIQEGNRRHRGTEDHGE